MLTYLNDLQRNLESIAASIFAEYSQIPFGSGYAETRRALMKVHEGVAASLAALEETVIAYNLIPDAEKAWHRRV
jgi:hypothetical protein